MRCWMYVGSVRLPNQADPQRLEQVLLDSESSSSPSLSLKNFFISGGKLHVFQKIAVVVFVFCLSAAAFAQEPSSGATAPPTHHEYGMMRMRGMASDQEIDRAVDTLQRTLNLNASQVTNVRDLARARRDSFRSIREQSRPKFEQLMSML